jgi:hypothetical protein
VHPKSHRNGRKKVEKLTIKNSVLLAFFASFAVKRLTICSMLSWASGEQLLASNHLYGRSPFFYAEHQVCFSYYVAELLHVWAASQAAPSSAD